MKPQFDFSTGLASWVPLRVIVSDKVSKKKFCGETSKQSRMKMNTIGGGGEGGVVCVCVCSYVVPEEFRSNQTP